MKGNATTSASLPVIFRVSNQILDLTCFPLKSVTNLLKSDANNVGSDSDDLIYNQNACDFHRKDQF